MFNRKLISALAVLALNAAPATSYAADGGAQRCLLQGHRVTSVKPYNTERGDFGLGFVSSPRLAGAELYVQAEPGLTAEWLRFEIDRQIATLRATKACAQDIREVRVQVDSAGAGFSVKLIALDADQAAAVLRSALRLRG